MSQQNLHIENSQISDKRKADHVQLAFESQTLHNDKRFHFEPLNSPLNSSPQEHPVRLGSKELKFPLWISSMTGGSTAINAQTINERLARVCRDFGIGMGLGSCRALLYDDQYLNDFAVRSIIGPDLPLYANIGIAQLEQLILDGQLSLLDQLVQKLEADGLILHVNPFQELFQPEGDRYSTNPQSLIEQLREHIGLNYNLIVKEVGQGFGPKSLDFLNKMDLTAIELAAFGGTNFAMLESLRDTDEKSLAPLIQVGNTLDDSVESIRNIKNWNTQLIFSGGITDFLDGYYYTEQISGQHLYAQASKILKHAIQSYESLETYVYHQWKGYDLAKSFLTLK